MSAFDPKAAVPDATNGRFTVGTTVATSEGRVGVGTDRKGQTFMVHAVGRTSESIALHAVAAAIASGKLIPYPDLAAAVASAGDVKKLQDALGKVA